MSLMSGMGRMDIIGAFVRGGCQVAACYSVRSDLDIIS